MTCGSGSEALDDLLARQAELESTMRMANAAIPHPLAHQHREVIR
jgi:hypothetical protein